MGEEAIGNVPRTLDDCSAGNDGTRGRVEAKWLAPAFAAVSLGAGDIGDAGEKGQLGVRACVWRRWCGCDIIYPLMQWRFPSPPAQSPQQDGCVSHIHAHTHTQVKNDCACFNSFRVILCWKDCHPFFLSHMHSAVGFVMVLKSTLSVIKFQMLNLSTGPLVGSKALWVLESVAVWRIK